MQGRKYLKGKIMWSLVLTSHCDVVRLWKDYLEHALAILLWKILFWKDQGHGNLSCSLLSFTMCGSWTGERWQGILSNLDTSADSTTMECRFFSHLWTYDIKSVSFCFTHLLSSPPSSTNHLSALLQSPRRLKVIFSCLSLTAVSNLRALEPWTAEIAWSRLREWEKTTHSS